jgi:hypothetical protein
MISQPLNEVVRIEKAANDEVERRAAATTTNEADLSQSSISLYGSPQILPQRSLEPFVRRLRCQHDWRPHDGARDTPIINTTKNTRNQIARRPSRPLYARTARA